MLKSLEEFNELIFTAKDNLYNSSEFTKEEVNQYFDSRTKNIKQDLEKHDKVMKLLEELFTEIETDKLTIISSGKPEIIKYCLVRLEPHKMESMHINENTYNIVEKLKELVGDNHD